MRNFLFSLLFLLTAFSANATTNLLTCSLGNIDYTSIAITPASIGFVTYNYSHTSIACPQMLSFRVREKENFKCAGFWSAYDDQGNLFDTLFEVQFEVDQKGQWSATYLTNHYYGRREITAKCQVSKNI